MILETWKVTGRRIFHHQENIGEVQLLSIQYPTVSSQLPSQQEHRGNLLKNPRMEQLLEAKERHLILSLTVFK